MDIYCAVKYMRDNMWVAHSKNSFLFVKCYAVSITQPQSISERKKQKSLENTVLLIKNGYANCLGVKHMTDVCQNSRTP